MMSSCMFRRAVTAKQGFKMQYYKLSLEIIVASITKSAFSLCMK